MKYIVIKIMNWTTLCMMLQKLSKTVYYLQTVVKCIFNYIIKPFTVWNNYYSFITIDLLQSLTKHSIPWHKHIVCLWPLNPEDVFRVITPSQSNRSLAFVRNWSGAVSVEVFFSSVCDSYIFEVYLDLGPEQSICFVQLFSCSFMGNCPKPWRVNELVW